MNKAQRSIYVLDQIKRATADDDTDELTDDAWKGHQNLQQIWDDLHLDDPRFREAHGMTEQPESISEEAFEALKEYLSNH